MTRPGWLRWPLMTKARYEREIKLVSDAAAAAIQAEYDRATKDGMRRVHAWAVEANYNVFNHGNPRGAAAAAFQEAERIFRPEPLTLKEVLKGA